MTKTATSSSISEVATQMTALLDQLEALIPEHPKPDAARKWTVRANARFAAELVTPTIAAVTNYPALQERKLFDVEAGRKALAVRDDLRPIAQRIAVIASEIEFAIDSMLADAAIETLQTYQWSKRHVKGPDGAGLRPYVSEMQRVVEKTINHRAKRENAEPVRRDAALPAAETAALPAKRENAEPVTV